jgi:hypothetical protein
VELNHDHVSRQTASDSTWWPKAATSSITLNSTDFDSCSLGPVGLEACITLTRTRHYERESALRVTIEVSKSRKDHGLKRIFDSESKGSTSVSSVIGARTHARTRTFAHARTRTRTRTHANMHRQGGVTSQRWSKCTRTYSSSPRSESTRTLGPAGSKCLDIRNSLKNRNMK